MGKIEPLVIQLKFKDAGSQAVIDKVKNSLKQLDNAAKGARPRIMGLRKEILAQGKASTKSVSNINAQRNALQALRDEAKIGGKAFIKLTADIKKLDAQMAKGGAAAPKRGAGARRATQTAGAIISGGIFGGPEGAIGGALGALGGVESAFAGAAIGAQVGGIRKALAASAEYAAEIGKLRIALKGVTEVENNASLSQSNFKAALDAAAQATRDYNVPQGAAVAGITRLTAAVTGAGGPVGDAATTFKNVTAAIKATGGSTEDVRGAITAMVQVFSKGKVSAEELSGQLGERLPGAVTMFAKANKMTLPELQKNLKAGTVGLNELMTFIEALGEEFDGTAKQIASSNEEAGARLTVAFDDMKLGVGNALMEVGAQFQDIFGKFITEITPKVISASEALAKALIPVAENLDIVVVALAGIVAGGVLGLIAKGVIAIVAAIKAATTVTAAFTGVLALNPIFAGAIVVGGIVAGIYAITRALKGQREEMDRIAKVGGKEGATGAQKAEAISTLKRRIGEQETIIEDNPADKTSDARSQQSADNRRRKAEKELRRLEKQLAFVTRVRKTSKPESDEDFKYDPVKPDGSDDSSGKKDNTQRLLQSATALVTKQRETLSILRAQNEVEKLLNKQANDRAALELRFADLKGRAKNEEAVAAIQEQQVEATELQQQIQRVQLENQSKDIIEKAFAGVRNLVDKNKEKLETDKEYNRLIAEGLLPSQAKQIIALNKQFEAGDKILRQRLLDLQALIAKGGLEEATIANLEREIELIKQKRIELGDETKDGVQGAKDDPTDKQKTNFQTFQDSFKAGIKDMGDLYKNLGEIGANAFQGMGDILHQFVTTGKADFKGFAASILSDLSKMFIKFALFQAIKGIFPGLNLANGGVINQGKVVPYAKGGVVNQPTIFPMTNGTGVMGEAGPEAVMPLKRGPSGRLGVEVNQSDIARNAMTRYSRRGSPSGGGAEAQTQENASEFANTPSAIDVRYTVERINSVDYVTADQFQNGMQQAAQQGAKQGEQQTLKRLQMSGSTRKRIGI